VRTHPAFVCFYGSFAQSFIYAKYLAMQISRNSSAAV